MSNWSILEGDNLLWLKDCPDNYFDAMVTDPPAGIGFMQSRNEWDSDKGGRDQWIAWLQGVMQEAYRCLKPGAHCLVWALPRTSHWTATALENAGFEIRHQIVHVYGSGFPKSQDVGKFIDKLAGAEREVVGRGHHGRNAGHGVSGDFGHTVDYFESKDGLPITAPATEEAKTWDGWGTALKPSHEIWWLCRKPLTESSIARNVLKWDTGALNIDAARVQRATDDVPGWHESGAKGSAGYQGEETFKIRDMSPEEIQERCGDKGRWPSDLILSHSPDCEFLGRGQMPGKPKPSGRGKGGIWTRGNGVPCGPEYGGESVPLFRCVPGCAVAELDRQSGVRRNGGRNDSKRRDPTSVTNFATDCATNYAGDSGGASRFFPTFGYFAKPSRAEREAGCEDLPSRILNRVNPGGLESEPRFAPVQVKNNHPTVKGIELCRWLARLITPPGGKLLDPFAGSGSIGCAAVLEGFDYVGIEKEPEYCEIARARIEYWANK